MSHFCLQNYLNESGITRSRCLVFENIHDTGKSTSQLFLYLTISPPKNINIPNHNSYARVIALIIALNCSKIGVKNQWFYCQASNAIFCYSQFNSSNLTLCCYPNDPRIVTPPLHLSMLSRLNKLDLCRLLFTE